MGIGLDLAGRRRDGLEFPLEISLSHVESPDGGLAMAFITDITERKRVQAQLEHQREVLYQNEKLAALGTMAAGIAHEMNNPLGIITTRIEVMLLDAEQQQLPAQVLQDLQALHRASQRVARIAASLRSFARHTPGDRVPLDLNAVVDESLQLMQKPLAADNVQVIASLDRELPPILGDATTLHQVLMNLLTNAREAMTTGGQIRIETAPADRPGWIRLVVADTGPGIPAEEISKIFDPFFTTKRTGTGLGLSVTYGIIQEHGGTVDVQSRPGAGTTFILSFPTIGPPGP
jgi:signal transduction histidine kinase